MSKHNSKMVQGHQARKRFGQNFLSDNYYIQRIVDAIHPQAQDAMVEIGPGLGAITELLIDKVKTLDVVELDRDLLPKLEAKFGQQAHFNIHHCDALKFNFAELQQQINTTGQIRIVGNLPYNISTPLIFHLLKQKSSIKDMYFMLQKEVVERICAAPNSKQYGRLSIMSQYHCHAEMLFTVPPGAFQPAPKVDSAIIRLSPHPKTPYPAEDPLLLGQLVTQAFNQRRKTLRNNLKKYLSAEQIEALGIDPSVRPETVSLEQFVQLANVISNQPTEKL